MLFSQAILKMKVILEKTINQSINVEQFELLCIEAKIDKNVLNVIEDLKIPKKTPRGLKLTKLATLVVAFMHILCYRFAFDEEGSVQFYNYPIISTDLVPLPVLNQEPLKDLTRYCIERNPGPDCDAVCVSMGSVSVLVESEKHAFTGTV